MVLLVLSAPLIACALPGEEMTKAEQDCCLQMSDECGGTQMSDSHTCCNKTPQVEGSTLKASSKYSPAAPQAAAHASLCATPEMAADRLPGPQNPCNEFSVATRFHLHSENLVQAFVYPASAEVCE